jgi:hypothetical protein
MAWAVFARGRKEEELAPRGSYSGGIGEGLEGGAGPVMHGGSRRLGRCQRRRLDTRAVRAEAGETAGGAAQYEQYDFLFIPIFYTSLNLILSKDGLLML